VTIKKFQTTTKIFNQEILLLGSMVEIKPPLIGELKIPTIVTFQDGD